MVKNTPVDAGDAGDADLIPGSGISPQIGIRTYCITENSTQHSVMNYMGNESKKKSGSMYMYHFVSLCCTAETNTTL